MSWASESVAVGELSWYEATFTVWWNEWPKREADIEINEIKYAAKASLSRRNITKEHSNRGSVRMLARGEVLAAICYQ
jgi:hypothetical protein